MGDVWKPSRKEKWTTNAHSATSSSPSSSSSKFALPRSFSAKSSSSRSTGNLMRSGSQRSSLSSAAASSAGAPSSKGSLSRSLSHKGSNITRKCSNLAKEQKARFYIMKRCVAMLLRWRKHDDS